jgi:hypothetical protein
MEQVADTGDPQDRVDEAPAAADSNLDCVCVGYVYRPHQRADSAGVDEPQPGHVDNDVGGAIDGLGQFASEKFLGGHVGIPYELDPAGAAGHVIGERDSEL